ncbi:MAG: hypothetical protein WC027_00920 [Candidatus Paceibacterota bacterium]
MIFLFHGDDTAKARKVAQKNIEAAKKKHLKAEFFKLNNENFSENRLDELIASQGLFYSGSIIFADNLLEEDEVSEIVIKKMKEISTSPNLFIFLEKKLNKKELETFKKYSQKIEELKKLEKKLNKKEALALKGEKIDFFEFANALGDRNKKLLWTLYQDALAEKVPSEEVHGIFFWKVKSLLSSGYTNRYDKKTLKEMSTKLFNMYHLAHRGEIDFPTALERFILEI